MLYTVSTITLEMCRLCDDKSIHNIIQDRTVLKVYKKIAIAFGVCPFGVGDNGKTDFCSKLYSYGTFILLNISNVIIYYYQVVTNHIQFTMMENILNFGAAFATSCIYSCLLYSRIFKSDEWIRLFSNIEKFDDKCSTVNHPDDVESSGNIPGRIGNNVPNSKVDLIMECKFCKLNKQMTVRINYSQHRFIYESFKFLLFLMMTTGLLVADATLWSHHGYVNQSSLLNYVPLLSTCIFEIFICQFIKEISKILTTRFNMVNEQLQLFIKGVKGELYVDLKLKLHNTKQQYQLLHQSANSLSKIFGSSILFMFAYSEIQFLMSVAFCIMTKSNFFLFLECFVSGFFHVVSIILISNNIYYNKNIPPLKNNINVYFILFGNLVVVISDLCFF